MEMNKDSGAQQADGLSQAEPDVSALRASIPSARTLGQRCADSISPDLFGPLVKRLADDLYERLLDTVQDYLCENAEWNIAERISVAERSAKTARERARAAENAITDLLGVLREAGGFDDVPLVAQIESEWGGPR
jgi:hypothetical protein